MTREQIEAWLALEGWVAYVQPKRSDRVEREGVCIWRRWGETDVICSDYDEADRFYDNDYSTPSGYGIFSDTELQLIYQEIIKHEKD